MRRLLQILRKADGAEIAEVALVLPLVFMFLLGIVWFGRAFNIYSTITQAAQQGALTAARATCATCDTSFPDKALVAGKVVAVLQASSLDPSQIQRYQPPTVQGCRGEPACQTSQKVTICSQVLLNPIAGTPPPTPQPPQCGTLVSFQYPFQFYLPFTSLNGQPVLLTATAQSRMEN